MARDRQRAKQRRAERRAGRGPRCRSTVPPAEVDEARLAEAGARAARRAAEGDDGARIYEDELGDERAERAPDAVEGDAVSHRDIQHAEHPRRKRGRVFTFLGHCVDELRRVQWPNRRQVGQATAVVLGFVVIAGRLPRPARRALAAAHRSHPLRPQAKRSHVPLVRHQHLFRAREEGQAEPRASRLVAQPDPLRAPGRRPDRDRAGDEGQPEDLRREADHARLRAGEHGPQRGLLAGRQGHARA